MGWQDSAVVDEKPKWANSPEIDAPQKKEKRSIIDNIGTMAKTAAHMGASILPGGRPNAVSGAVSEPIAAMASGAVAKPVSEVAGLAATGYEMATGGEGASNIPGFQQEVQDRLTYQPQTAAGKSPYNPINAATTAIGKAVGAVTPDKARLGDDVPESVLRNFASEAVPQAIGFLGVKGAPKAAAPAQKAASSLRKGAEDLMQSALKPTPKDLVNGKAAKAIDTMLEKGIPATPKGMEQIRAQIDVLNDQIADVIKNSTARVETRKVLRPVAEKLKSFRNQVNEVSDVNAIKKSWEEFKNHPVVKSGEGGVAAAKAKIADRDAAAAKALQDAGKLKTFEQQQQNLAHGGGIKSSTAQPEGQPYINVGGIKAKEKISPSAYPVRGMPRIAGKYTQQIERVPEGAAGYKDAMEVYRTRKAEANAARQELLEAQKKEGTFSVQKAQDLKQGTYKQLSKKYGQLGSADVEAQKAIARGLKEEVAAKVPEVAPLNLAESKLLNVLSVAERRIVMEANKNPMGLSLLAKNPKAWAAFMMDRSATAKSLLARIMNRASQKLSGAASSGVAENVAKAGALTVPSQVEKEKQYQLSEKQQLKRNKYRLDESSPAENNRPMQEAF